VPDRALDPVKGGAFSAPLGGNQVDVVLHGILDGDAFDLALDIELGAADRVAAARVLRIGKRPATLVGLQQMALAIGAAAGLSGRKAAVYVGPPLFGKGATMPCPSQRARDSRFLPLRLPSEVSSQISHHYWHLWFKQSPLQHSGDDPQISLRRGLSQHVWRYPQ
jgi:hypothetical protein